MIRTEKEGIVIIFAKAPDPGAVKTRLQPILTVEERSALQAALLLDTLHLTDSLPQNRALACAPDIDHPFFARCRRERALSLVRQQGETLGARMKNAFAWGFDQRFRKVVLIGSDAPTLPADFIQAAFDQLDQVSVVIGPSLDGGYYLIGACPPVPELFDGIGWGSDQVLVSTLRQINAAQLDCHLLPFWYDIDRPNDLTVLKEQLDLLARQGKPVPKETADFLRSLPSFHERAGR